MSEEQYSEKEVIAVLNNLVKNSGIAKKSFSIDDIENMAMDLGIYPSETKIKSTLEQIEKLAEEKRKLIAQKYSEKINLYFVPIAFLILLGVEYYLFTHDLIKSIIYQATIYLVGVYATYFVLSHPKIKKFWLSSGDDFRFLIFWLPLLVYAVARWPTLILDKIHNYKTNLKELES